MDTLPKSYSSMTPLQMIAEWKKGCSNAPKETPEDCPECTRALVACIEASLKDSTGKS
jgi:hypothetical protein